MSTEIVERVFLESWDLVQRVIVGPHSLFNSFTEVDEELSVVRPISAEGNLEEGSNYTSSVLLNQQSSTVEEGIAYLSDICGVRDKGKILQEHFRNMRL